MPNQVTLSESLAEAAEGATPGEFSVTEAVYDGRSEGWIVLPGIAFEMTEGDAKFLAFCANNRATLVAALAVAEARSALQEWHDSPRRSVSCLVMHSDGICPDFAKAEDERRHLEAREAGALSAYRSALGGAR